MKHIVLILLLSILCFVSCDDNVATGPNVQPELSADSIHMGTVFAGISSPTYLLKLYNRNRDDLKITQIKLRNAAESGFRMNVDGMNGSDFTNSDLMRIAAGDSMFIFVEATFSKLNSSESNNVECIDYIDIVCNGKTQTVVLDAQSKEIRELRGHEVLSNEVVREDEEVQVFDSLVVSSDAELLMLPGSTFYLHDKAKIIVYGALSIQGSQEKPVTIRGDRLDNMFYNLPYDNLPSQWGGIVLTKESHDNRISFADIRGMTDGIIIESDAHFFSSRIKNSDGNLISARNAEMVVENCELSNASGCLLEVIGGNCEVIHSTLANYNFASPIRQEAVRLSNCDTVAHADAPLIKCNFVNTIIWGKKFVPDVRLDYFAPEQGDSIFCYSFDHCLLHADGADDEQFVATMWNLDPQFLNIDDKNYTFDLHLSSESPCLGAGTPAGATLLPLDIEGKPRAANPSLGCYE